MVPCSVIDSAAGRSLWRTLASIGATLSIVDILDDAAALV